MQSYNVYLWLFWFVDLDVTFKQAPDVTVNARLKNMSTDLINFNALYRQYEFSANFKSRAEKATLF